MLYPPVVSYLLKAWQLVLSGLRFVQDKAQDVFNWFMNKLVAWLCRFYMQSYPY